MIENTLLHSALHSFSIKNISYDKMDLRLFHFYVMTCNVQKPIGWDYTIRGSVANFALRLHRKASFDSHLTSSRVFIIGLNSVLLCLSTIPLLNGNSPAVVFVSTPGSHWKTPYHYHLKFSVAILSMLSRSCIFVEQ